GGPGTDPATIATLRARMAAGQPFNCEVLNYAKDGTSYWVAVDLQPVHDTDGTLLNFITIETDITARKLAESALRTSHQEYRALFDQASEGIFIVNQAGQFIDVNNKGCQLSGYGRGELLTLTVSDLVAETESTNLVADFAQLALGEHLFNERQLRHRDGHLVTVEVSASRLADGRLQAYVRDISERVQAEEVRRQYIATLEALHGTALQLATSASLDAILDTILRNSIDLLHFNYGGIYLREAETDTFVLQRSLNTRHVQPGERIHSGRGLIGQAIEYGQTLLIENYDEWPLRRDDIPAGLLGSALAVPLQHDNRLIGIIFCARPQAGSTSADEVKLMELMAGQAEVAIERARLLTDLRTSNDELAAERRMLTQRVRERTEELSVTNTELRRALRAKDGFLATMSH
ncbi:MAG: PAS domain S-box protein, partial [Caldilineaceae bacterium]|nr:PAS domain S-box protein [Caldilineaceae bacterium]